MKQKTLVFVLIFLILCLLAFGLFKKKAVAPQIDNAPSENAQVQQTLIEKNMVLISPNGFEPKVLRIKKGEDVIWMNATQKNANVSSDNHPDHTLFPFLNVGNIKKETSASVVFKEAGTFTYHNHLNPSQTGTVIVE